MLVRSPIFAACFSILLAACLASCRIPEPVIPVNPAVGDIYDPKTADVVAKAFSQSPQRKQQLERFRTALAEPVSVIEWQPKEQSVWQIYYATNRTGVRSPDGTMRFGNEWGNEVSFGTSRLAIPWRERGKNAELPRNRPQWASWIPGRSNSDKQTKEVVLDEVSSLTPAGFLEQTRQTVERSAERDVLVFVHGFNVDFESCLSRTAQIALDLPFNGAVIAYSWPSQGGIGNYSKDEEIVADSVGPFVSFLEHLNHSLPPDARIHLIVHSMGNRLVLKGLSRLPDDFRQPARFENVILAAPDVGVSDFMALAPYAVTSAKRVTLLVNGGDTALIASKGLNQEQRIGDAFPPVVFPEVETIDASTIETSFMGHSYYCSNRGALSDLFAVIKENRGASERPWLRAESDSRGTWWVYASQPTEIRCVWYFDHLANPKAGTSPR